MNYLDLQSVTFRSYCYLIRSYRHLNVYLTSKCEITVQTTNIVTRRVYIDSWNYICEMSKNSMIKKFHTSGANLHHIIWSVRFILVGTCLCSMDNCYQETLESILGILVIMINNITFVVRSKQYLRTNRPPPSQPWDGSKKPPALATSNGNWN